jgi:hypothetical protein
MHTTSASCLLMGCDVYSSCHSGFCIDGFVGRFAAVHFGQRNARSPLNALMRCIQRFLARRAPRESRPLHSARVQKPEADIPVVPPPSPTPSGFHPTALQRAVWVDNAVYVTKTRPPRASACTVGVGSAMTLLARPGARSAGGTAWRTSSASVSAMTSASSRHSV